MHLDDVRNTLRGYDPVSVTDPSRSEAAVAVVLLSDRDVDTEILLIKRATRPGDPWSGQMALPGGRREMTDTDLIATAVRETIEETGIDLSQAEFLGQLDDLAPQTTTLPRILVRPFVFALNDPPKIKVNAEVDGHLWASLDGLRTSERETSVSVRGSDLTVQAYHLGGEVIWGMTYRIINGFMNLR